MMNEYQRVVYIPNKSSHQQTINDYTQRCQLVNIMGEMTRVILRKNTLTSSQTINEYLQQCNKGQHVLLKSYGSFSKSALNRICFLSNFIRIFQLEASERNGVDYYQLFRLLCSDFPKEIISRSVEIVTEGIDKMGQLLNSKKFIKALYFFVIYNSFSEHLLKFFENQKKLKSLLDLFYLLKDLDKKIVVKYQKLPLSVSIPIILRIIKTNHHSNSSIVFLTDQTIEDYFKHKLHNNNISFNDFARNLIQSIQFTEIVDRQLDKYDNQNNWATQASKIILNKDPSEIHQINSKKSKLKK